MRNEALLKDLAGCGSAETLLAAILKHHPDLSAPVPVETIAKSVGITAFRDLDVDGATSASMVAADRKQAVILCSPTLTAPRRRFAIAHQLGHVLLAAQGGDRQCTNRDLSENRRDTPQRKEEMQANRFAAGLLMPKPLFLSSVDALGKPMVANLPTIAKAFDVTLEAAVSRYADLTQTMSAFLFVRGGVIRYARASRSFPALSLHPGDPAPSLPSIDPADKVVWIATEARDWLVMSRDVRPPKLSLQILGKDGSLQLVMLFANAAAERRADEEDEKAATQSPKFGR